MTSIELEQVLTKLRNLEAETEVVEFKEAKTKFDFDKLGQYFSALANEANLKNVPCAWLVFGVNDKHDIVGTHFRTIRKSLNNLKKDIAKFTMNHITFIEIHELKDPEGRVILFQIPAAPSGIPISFRGHYYGRDNESLGPLNLEEIERIRSQVTEIDWSAGIVEDASIEDLDKAAITLARKNYKDKFPRKSDEVDTWDEITFLNKAKLTKRGKITRTTLLLLGKDDAEDLLAPAFTKILWLLRNNKNIDKDYEILGIPYLLAVDKVYKNIRNLKYRYLQEGTIFPTEVNQYEPYIIREALNNCIAHQDYTKQSRIHVVEYDDHLIFTNAGTFIPGTVEQAIKDDAPPEYYRNKFLANAMFNLDMVDTVGGGIKKMFLAQRNKYFPLPDYDLSKGGVKVTIWAKILDMNYTMVLARNPDLSLSEIILLDKVQKRQPLTILGAKQLRSKKLIEGRKPNYFISKSVAKTTGQKAEYSKNKAFDKQYYLDLIIKSIREHSDMSRKDIDVLLWDKLPDVMSEEQKKNRIRNLLTELRKAAIIKNNGSYKESKWVLLN